MSAALKAQYKTLGDLKNLDDEMIRYRRALSKIPKDLSQLEGALNLRKEAFESSKEQFETAEKSLKRAEQDLKSFEDKIIKAEAKLMECKTNEEYKAAQKEISNQKNETGGLEEDILKLLSQMEGKKEKLAEDEKEFRSYEEGFKADEKQLMAEKAKLEALLSDATEKQNALKAQLVSDIRNRYERTLRGGIEDPIANIDNSRCRGCNVKVRPQLFNQVISRKEICRCPNCNRILIPSTSPEDAELSAADASHSNP